jgi:hypothetical protein
LTAVFSRDLPAILYCLSTRLSVQLEAAKNLASLPCCRFNQTIILPTSFLPPEMAEPIPPPPPPENRRLPTSQGKVSKWKINYTTCSTSCSRTARYIYSSRFALDSQVLFLNSLLYPLYLLDLLTYSLLRSITPLSLILVNHLFLYYYL